MVAPIWFARRLNLFSSAELHRTLTSVLSACRWSIIYGTGRVRAQMSLADAIAEPLPQQQDSVQLDNNKPARNELSEIEESGKQQHFPIPTPECHGLSEIPLAAEERAELNRIAALGVVTAEDGAWKLRPIQRYLARGLAVTTGSAIEESPPSDEECLQAFLVSNSPGLTAGARAWTKHAHRAQDSTCAVTFLSLVQIN